MTDKELLELAAKACGYRIVDNSHPVSLYIESDGCYGGVHWNPLTDDGDAFRLAVRLGMKLEIENYRIGYIEVNSRDGIYTHYDDKYSDVSKAIRKLIVNVAAEIGEYKCSQA